MPVAQYNPFEKPQAMRTKQAYEVEGIRSDETTFTVEVFDCPSEDEAKGLARTTPTFGGAQPCEDGCNRNEVDDFVGINAVNAVDLGVQHVTPSRPYRPVARP